MICGNRSAYGRSAQTAYNNATQTINAAGTIVEVLGTQACDSGCAIDTTTDGFVIRNSGIYRISYDIEYTAGANPGTATFQLYNGETALPCAYVSQAAVASGVYYEHLETTLEMATCSMIHPVISARISGLDGTVRHVCASAVKLA